MRGDGRNHQAALVVQVEYRAVRRDVIVNLQCRPLVSAGSKTGRFTRGVDTPHLHRYGGEAGNAKRENHDKSGDGKRCLDRGGAVIAG
jgi:hypothetical protein